MGDTVPEQSNIRSPSAFAGRACTGHAHPHQSRCLVHACTACDSGLRVGLNGKQMSIHMYGPHKCRTYRHAAQTHLEIRCRVTLLFISDSPYGDVRPSRRRTLGGHPAISHLFPQRKSAWEIFIQGAPMRMLDSTIGAAASCPSSTARLLLPFSNHLGPTFP